MIGLLCCDAANNPKDWRGIDAVALGFMMEIGTSLQASTAAAAEIRNFFIVSQQLFFVGKDDLLRREAYEEFIDFRAEKIAEKINEFLELGTT